MISACGLSTEQLTATFDAAQNQTQTAAPTQTPTQTNTPTAKPTTTLSSTPTPQTKIIKRIEIQDVEIFSNPLDSTLLTFPKDNFKKTLEEIKKSGTTKRCPEVWIGKNVGKPIPSYGLIIIVAPSAEEKGFIYAIHPTIPEMEPYSFVGVVTIPPKSQEKNFVIVEYDTPSGEPNPKELEINIVFPGCEIYSETVVWP